MSAVHVKVFCGSEARRIALRTDSLGEDVLDTIAQMFGWTARKEIAVTVGDKTFADAESFVAGWEQMARQLTDKQTLTIKIVERAQAPAKQTPKPVQHRFRKVAAGPWPAYKPNSLPVFVGKTEDGEEEWVLIGEGKQGVARLPRQLASRFTDVVTLFVNGEKYSLSNVDPSYKLARFLRNELGLTGTKIGCGEEAGCGACTVLFESNNGGNKVSFIGNSCLRPVAACDGFSITTIEGVGGRSSGYHPVQQALASCDGSQCGFCSPGMVMNMYGLLAKNPKPTPAQVEAHLDGNICRCTGYRPILKAFKGFAGEEGEEELSKDSDPKKKHGDDDHDHDHDHDDDGEDHKHEAGHKCSKGGAGCGGKGECGGKGKGKGGCQHKHDTPASCKPNAAIVDIEDMHKAKRPFPKELMNWSPRPLVSTAGDKTWLRPLTLADLYAVLKNYDRATVQLVVGNTAQGVSKYYLPAGEVKPVSVLVDVRSIPELTAIAITATSIKLGAAVTLTELIDSLNTAIKTYPTTTSAFGAVVAHLQRVANNQVRNVASWAGNLILAKNYPNFASDVGLLLCGLGAQVVLASSSGTRTLSVYELFTTTLAPTEIIQTLSIPLFTSAGYRLAFDTFKVMNRSVNTHAMLNAAFSIVLDGPSATAKVVNATIVYGGLKAGAPFFATQTQTYLKGRVLNVATLQGAISLLDRECVAAAEPDNRLWAGVDPVYRHNLVLTLFYKYFLSLQPTLNPQLQSAPLRLYNTRGLSSGTQTYVPDPSLQPVSYPVHSVSGLIQASGEALYTDDIPTPKRGLYSSLVLSTIAKGKITKIDASKALALSGVVDFIWAKTLVDMGIANDANWAPGVEELFAGNEIVYCGQPVGLVVAESQELADEASKLVVVEAVAEQPVLTLEEAIAKQSFYPGPPDPIAVGDFAAAYQKAPNKITGTVTTKAQSHFYMETQACMASLDENGGLQVNSATQSPAQMRAYLSAITGIPANKVNVEVNRLGGGFGGKIDRCDYVAAATTVAALKLKRPVRIQLQREKDFESVGKRNPYLIKYEVGVESDLTISAFHAKIYVDGGAAENSNGDAGQALVYIDNCYNFANLLFEGQGCLTNTPPSTAVRAPNCFQSIWLMEQIMDNVASAIGANPKSLREKNFYKVGDVTPFGQVLDDITLSQVWKDLETRADYVKRAQAVADFNSQNVWKKRGISMTPSRYGIDYFGTNHSVLLNVLADDGSIQITHSGVDMGQGVSTKVVQSLAYALKVDPALIQIRTLSTDKIPNFVNTGGSIASEMAARAAYEAGNALNERLEPVRKQFPDLKWPELIAKAAQLGVNLSVAQLTSPPSIPDKAFRYFVYCAGVTEVELDVLTGEWTVLRTDIVYDSGSNPLNPALDVGQIEGAFIQGLGFFLTEDVVIRNDGKLLSNGTWDYRVPMARDIPVELNVAFLPNSKAPTGFLGSKAIGEPPMQVSATVPLALRQALLAFRAGAGLRAEVSLDQPVTQDKLQKAAEIQPSQLVF